MIRGVTGSFWKTTLTFAIAGPPIGGLSLVAWWILLSFAQTGSVEGRDLWLVPAGVFYGYFFGLLPAFITGSLGSALSPAIRSTGAWVVTSAGIGWLVTVLALGVSGLLTDDRTDQLWNGLIGAIPAALCSILARKFRPRP